MNALATSRYPCNDAAMTPTYALERSMTMTTTTDAAIELDVVDFDASTLDAFPHVSAREVTDRGPGGGWPVWRFSGPRNEILGWLAASYLAASDDPEAYLAEHGVPVEHRPDDDDRCACGAMTVYWDDPDRDGFTGDGCERGGVYPSVRAKVICPVCERRVVDAPHARMADPDFWTWNPLGCRPTQLLHVKCGTAEGLEIA